MLIREYIFAKSSPVHWIRGFFRIRFYLFLFSGTPILHVITVKFSNFHCLRKNDYESFISINVKNMVGKKCLLWLLSRRLHQMNRYRKHPLHLLPHEEESMVVLTESRKQQNNVTALRLRHQRAIVTTLLQFITWVT